MPDLSHFHIIQSSRLLLTIAADERYGRTFLEKSGAILHLPLLHTKPSGYVLYIDFLHDYQSNVTDIFSNSTNLTKFRSITAACCSYFQ